MNKAEEHDLRAESRHIFITERRLANGAGGRSLRDCRRLATAATLPTTRMMLQKATASKRWASEGDLITTRSPLKRHRIDCLTGRALVTLITTDGAAFVLDTTRGGRFATRFAHSHLVCDGADARPRKIALPIDRVAFAPVYARVTIDPNDFGTTGDLDVGGLVSSSLCLCVDRLDAIDATANVLGVPAVAMGLRRWVDLAAPDPRSFGVSLSRDRDGVVFRCAFAPCDIAALGCEVGIDAARRLCDAVAPHRVGARASPVVRHIALARLEREFKTRIACARQDALLKDASFASKCCWDAVATPLQEWMDFLLATSDLPDVVGFYERARRVLDGRCLVISANSLAVRPLDDLARVARIMPEHVRIDNPYHVTAALMCGLTGADAALGTEALAGAVDGDLHLLGLLADAVCGFDADATHAVRALTNIRVGDLALGPCDLDKTDQAIQRYYSRLYEGGDALCCLPLTTSA